MAANEAKPKIWLPPFAALILWEAANLAYEFLFPAGPAKLLAGSLLFFGEFALVFILSLWLGAYYSRRLGSRFQETLQRFAVFFAAFLLLALAVTLATGTDLSELGSFVSTLSLFALLGLVKLALGVLALAIAFYFPPRGKWDEFAVPGAALSLIAFAAAAVPGFLVGAYLATSFDFQSSEGFSLTAGNCTPGEWTYVKVLGVDFNITVTGTETYRTRLACHAAGSSDSFGSNVTIDVYGQDSESICYVTSRVNRYNVTDTKESCRGDWPGYVGAAD